ncbi:ATP-binding cassette domain-containing protein [Castellaniella sp.]|uniref:branched-chain amino acid ABC transporter ATP-binding protein/permease n=1 Tax=Castellaniella sp. TaxID=1955812 RepID=UPI003566171C
MSAERLPTLNARRAPRIGYFLLLLLVLALPWLPINSFFIHLAQTYAYTAIAVIGLNVLLGLSGQMSLGQAGFYALGSYGSALIALRLGWPISISIVLGTLVATIAGALVGWFALQTRGLYLAMATMAVGFIIEIVAQRWIDLTGGAMGLTGIPEIWFESPADPGMAFLYLAGICLLIVQISADYVNDSFVGRKLRAVRESEVFASSVGTRVSMWRAVTFAACAGLAGLSGALFAHQSGYVGSDAFSIQLSISLLIAAVIGGLGTRSGPLLGTFILIVMVEVISGIEEYGLLIYGGILLIVLVLFPKGAAGILPLLRITRRDQKEQPLAEPQAKVKPFDMGMSGASLRVQDVTKGYSGVVAVDSVSIHVQAGTVHGLIGPNGAGKSTLINVVAGLYRAEAGSIFLDEHDITGIPTPVRAQRGMARTFQNLQLIDALTALENVQLGFMNRHSVVSDFGAWWNGVDFERTEKEAAIDIMSFLGIAHLANRSPTELSYGHRKLVELARAIAQKPKLMLLDEPIAGLNTNEAREISHVIRKLRELGVTILLVEHNMEFVMSICDTVSVLDYGQLIASGTPAEIQANERVHTAYLGKDESA